MGNIMTAHEVTKPDWIVCPEDEILYERASQELTREECQDRDYVVEHFRAKDFASPSSPPPILPFFHPAVNIGDVIETNGEFGVVSQVDNDRVTYTELMSGDTDFTQAQKITRKYPANINDELWQPINSTLATITRVHVAESKEALKRIQELSTKQTSILQSCLHDFLENGRPIVCEAEKGKRPFLKVPVPLRAWHSQVVSMFKDMGILISTAPIIELPIVGSCMRTKYFMLVFLKDEHKLSSRNASDLSIPLKTSSHFRTKI